MENGLYETKVAFESDNIRLSMPLMKVDKERRLVHGFATLDNLDKQADIVTKAASVGAFTRFRGNIREQHDPHKAVGRIINFKEDSLHDPDTGKTYSGVFVSAYVSKGAEDTWQKVLDGTLTGFSIGGRITDQKMLLMKTWTRAFASFMDTNYQNCHWLTIQQTN